MKIPKYIMLIVAGISAVGLGAYFAWFRRKTLEIPSNYVADPSKTIEFQTRKLNFYANKSSNLPQLALGFSGEQLADSYFPMIELSDPNWNQANRIKNQTKVNNLIAKYDPIVRKASQIHKVPRLFIYGLMAVENLEGNPLAVSTAAAFGVMQIKHTTATDSVQAAYNLKVLQPSQIEFLKSNKKFGYNNKGEIKIAVKDLYDTEININLACIEISILIDKFGLDDPHKIMLSYNQGRNRLGNDRKTHLAISEMYQFYKTSKPEGAAYLLRTLGKDGSFDILFNALKVQD